MLKSLVQKNKQIFDFVLMGLICAILLISLISLIAGFGAGFGTVLANIIDFVILIALLGGLLFFIVTKKTDIARKLGLILLIYWVVSNLLSIGNPFSLLREGATFAQVIYAIVEILAGLTFLGVFVLYILSAVFGKGKDYAKIIDYLLLGFLALVVVGFAFRLINAFITKVPFRTWIAYFDSNLFIPILGVLGFIYVAPEKIK